MSKVFSPSGLLSVQAQKRFSKHPGFGLSIFGFSNYAGDFLGFIFEPYGMASFGEVVFGNWFLLSGIYQLRHCREGKIPIRMGFYNYGITHTAGQQIRREKFDAAVAAWQGLTEEQKEIYRGRAKGKKFSGYNLFVKEYLLS